ncbi:hypothetical protein GCM10010222_65500 [Streptomyces tanashiensis]|uniref:hypothetical protein n=1 Tax=Streptomyces tanashiensis TaxID=67367 RepID=UPI00167C3630|nr:hypothetical protein [Streptomyces tanashiensis]GGT14417.1 hypothetical protein GCM10010222_65500 [Streptomyces tanashiensis]
MAFRPLPSRAATGTPTRLAGPARRAALKVPLLIAAGTTCAVAAAQALFASPVAAAPELVDRHAVVLVNFKNRPLADAQKTHDLAVQNFFGAGDSLASYYAENSGHRMSVVPAEGDGVFGPFTIDLDDSAACETGKIAELARKAVSDVTYDRISVVFRTDFCGNWWGLGSQPGPVTWFHEGAVADKAALYHELGHNLGFAHQERELCPAGTLTDCTRDGYSRRTPMGAGGAKKGLSAPELLAHQWLTTLQTVTPTGSTTVRLTPLHAAGTSGVRAVDLPLNAQGDRIVVEYRIPDATTRDIDVAQGVNFYHVPEGRYDHAVMVSNAQRDDTSDSGSFAAGSTSLTDTAAQLSISVERVSATGADVRIRLGADAKTALGTALPTDPPTKERSRSAGTTAPAPHTSTEDTAAIGPVTVTVAPGPSAHGEALATTGAGPAAENAVSAGAIGCALIAAGGGTVFFLRRRGARGRY